MLLISSQNLDIFCKQLKRKPRFLWLYILHPFGARGGGWGHFYRGKGGVAYHSKGPFSKNDLYWGVGTLKLEEEDTESESGEGGEGSSNVPFNEVGEDKD